MIYTMYYASVLYFFAPQPRFNVVAAPIYRSFGLYTRILPVQSWLVYCAFVHIDRVIFFQALVPCCVYIIPVRKSVFKAHVRVQRIFVDQDEVPMVYSLMYSITPAARYGAKDVVVLNGHFV